ncbi:MAG: BA14K family protein [Rhizobiaceae bacterium]|nr:BA14K family protein [Rhizobiaceae bacterium]
MNLMHVYLAASVALWTAVSAIPASADPFIGGIEHHDCYSRGLHWRYSDGFWRYGPHDTALIPGQRWLRADGGNPQACGTYFRKLARDDSSADRNRTTSSIAVNTFRGPHHSANCARRYRTYDARSNTFVAKDGRRKQCRLR